MTGIQDTPSSNPYGTIFNVSVTTGIVQTLPKRYTRNLSYGSDIIGDIIIIIFILSNSDCCKLGRRRLLNY